MNTITDQEVQAYVDGELAPDDAARIEKAIASDVLVAARVEREKRLRAQVRGAYDPVLDEPVPSRLRGLLEGPSRGMQDDNVVALDARRAAPRASRWRGPALALAASVAALALMGWLRAPAGDMTMQGGRLVARGALSQALDTTLASAPDPRAAVSIGLSFRDADGHVCRSFSTRATGLAGLACREGDAWTLPVVSSVAAPAPSEVRQAASAMPPEVQAAVDARMRGDAFDAAQERAAQARGWR